MEYCEDGSLHDYIVNKNEKKETISLSTCISFMFQLFFGLYYLHDQKIVHRDLKPGNILVSSKCLLKISDFGLSKKLLTANEECQSLHGTCRYMAPEVLYGKYTISVDMYSYGVTLFTIFTGCRYEPENTVCLLF